MKALFRLLLFALLFTTYDVATMKLKKNIFKRTKFSQTSPVRVPSLSVNKQQVVQKDKASHSHIKFPSNLSYSQKTEYFGNLIENRNRSLWKQQKISPFGYWNTTIKYPIRSYTTPVKNEDFGKDAKNHIILDEKDPQFSEKIVNIINRVKSLAKNSHSGFSQADDSKKRRNNYNNKKKEWLQAAIGAAVAAGTLAGLDHYLSYLRDEKRKEGSRQRYMSQEPFDLIEAPFRYPKELYKYTLNGKMASTMDPDEFVAELHKDGLTAEDPPKIQCQIQAEEELEKLMRIANLTDEERILFQNILNLPHQLFKGHYNEDNITFDGEFGVEIKQVVKDALRKADVPFKVRVHASQGEENEKTLGATYLEKHCNTSFKYHVATSSTGLTGESVDVVMYLSPTMLSSQINPRLSLDQKMGKIKGTIAHEVAHIANLHSFQDKFARAFLLNEKRLNKDILKRCEHIIDTIHEYQADMLPLSDPEYAQAQYVKFKERLKPTFWGPRYMFFDISVRPDIYIPTKYIYVFAERAVKLHEAEKKINEQKLLLQGAHIEASR